MSLGDDGHYRREALFSAERPVLSEEDRKEAVRAGRRKTRLRRWASTLGALSLIGGASALMWHAYNWGVGEVENSQIPLVSAAEGKEKVPPKDRGGLDVPYQDSLVLNGEPGTEVERIVPPPEDPVLLAVEPAASPSGQQEQNGVSAPAPEASGQDPIGDMIEQTATLAADSAAAGLQAEVQDEVAPQAEVTPQAQVTPQAEVTQQALAEPSQATQDAQAAEVQEAPAAEPRVQTAQVGQVSGYKVQLASVQDGAAAEQEWQRLQRRYPDLLGSLSLQVQTVDIEGRGTFHRIQAGPLPSQETASDLCDQLKGRDQPCIVVAP